MRQVENVFHTRAGLQHRYDAGFTLIELMISIVLGLLITAAALSMFLTSQRSLTAQSAASDIQDDGLFGVDTLVQSIRMANFGSNIGSNQSRKVMNELTPQGGIVITVPTNAAAVDDSNLKGVLTTPSNSPVQPAFLARTEGGPSNIDGTPSDQLVIQRQAADDTFDCQGNAVNAGDYIVERYFLRTDTTTFANEPNALALACTAASYTYNQALVPSNGMRLSNDLSGNGDVLMSRVDQFRFMLGVNLANNLATEPDKNKVRYMTLQEYMALPTASPTSGRPRIISIKISLLSRSANSTTSGLVNADQRFTMLGTEEKLDSSVVSGAKYQRQVYERTVFLRNARG